MFGITGVAFGNSPSNVPLFCELQTRIKRRRTRMEIIHLILPFVYYGFGIVFLLCEVIHFLNKRRQEKKLVKALDNLNKLIDTKFLDK